MLSYQHGYHAGVFADVVKHVTLTRILNYMTQKDKPLLYLDTHAGRGCYDLHDKQSLKTGDAIEGIQRLWQKHKHLSDVFDPYIAVIQQINTGNALQYYPGSTYLAISLLRTQDRIVCCELHPKEYTFLDSINKQNKRVFCKHENGLQALNALLPPKERRGIIFIDPSYEVKSDYRQITKDIHNAHKRFSTGVYCIWYPIIDKLLHNQLLRGLHPIDPINYLRIEFYLDKNKPTGMNGCGLWIINPPYPLEKELDLACKQLITILNPNGSSYLIETGTKPFRGNV